MNFGMCYQIGLIIMREPLSVFYPGSIYRTDWIRRAIRDYADICQIELQAQPEGTVCVFLKSKVDLALTAREFSNYLFELANAGGRDDSM